MSENLQQPNILVFNHNNEKNRRDFDLVAFAITKARYRALEFDDQEYALEEIQYDNSIDAMVVLSVAKQSKNNRIQLLSETEELQIPRLLTDTIPQAHSYIRSEKDKVIRKSPIASLQGRVIIWLASLDLKNESPTQSTN